MVGIGKSTLLGLIAGTLQPTAGHVTRNPKIRFAQFSQHHVDGLDLALTPLTQMLRTFPHTKEQEQRYVPAQWQCKGLGLCSVPQL